MSQKKKKKVVVTTQKKAAPTVSRRAAASASTAKPEEMIFNKSNYMWMGIGVALILVGMLLMLGGSMPSPDVWDDSIIYSFRITVLAPIVILAGLGVEIYAIFKD
jgi:hypothetical protein